MSKITEKLNRILAICEPVMTADRMQNVSIEVRDIKDMLRINADKTMNELLEHPMIKPYIKTKETYLITGSLGGTFGGYLSQISPYTFLTDHNLAIKFESPKIASGMIDLVNSQGNELVCGIVSMTSVNENDLEISKSKEEIVNKMHELISKGENIPADTFKEWNEFVENC